MGQQNTLVWVLILLVGILTAGAFIFFGDRSTSTSTAQTSHSDSPVIDSVQTQQEGADRPNAVILIDAFHWGWVPQLLQSSAAVRVVDAPGAQGSEIHVPQGTQVKLILRNAGGNSALHQIFEGRFHDYFLTKYGEAWETIHQADHDAMDVEEDAQDVEAPHGDETHGGEIAINPILNHEFFLETYNVQAFLPNHPESNIQFREFTADVVGEFRFVCSNFCGVGHDAMQGSLVVFDANQPGD